MDLIAAIQACDVEKVFEILCAGTDAKTCDDWANVTPLHFAAQTASQEINELLLSFGADNY